MSHRFIPFVLRMVVRHRTRTILTLAGIAVAMFLFCCVQSMEQGVKAATTVTAQDRTLVVYRENRYCPMSSRLPQRYMDQIERIEGVEEVTPMRILVSNCRASLDVVTFRGVPESGLEDGLLRSARLVAGSVDDWRRRHDAALVGEALASRRGVSIGDRFSAAGITVHVAGIFVSDDPQHRNAAYTHLPFIQETAQRGGTGGVVTQFNVTVADPDRLEVVSESIDAAFANDTDPTSTWPEKAFVARAAQDIVQIAAFAGWLGWGALAAVFGLVANAIVLAVQSRVRDHAILQTLGCSARHIVGLIVAEGTLLGVLGGAIGAVAAWTVLSRLRLSLTMEGLNIELSTSPSILVTGLVASVAVGVLAGLVPAWQAASRPITVGLRSA